MSTDDGVGTLVLSLDAELAWGFHHEDPPPTDRVAQGRVAWQRLLDIFDEFRVPATWAVVGHLFRDACEGDHADHPAGPHCCRDDVGWLSARDAWFADSLVDQVRDAAVDHEVAGHGYTHVHFDHDAMTPSFARREVSRTREAAAGHGLSLSSFVFPVNEVAHRELLADAGFEAYRGTAPRGGTQRWRARKAGAAVFDRGAPPLVEPTVDEHGLVNVPASLYLFDGLGPLGDIVGSVREDPLAAWARRGIEAAAEEGGTFHLWCHPHNFTDDDHFGRLESVLAHATREVERGRLRVETMADVARRVRSSASSEPSPERGTP